MEWVNEMKNAYVVHVTFFDGSNPFVTLPCYQFKTLKQFTRGWNKDECSVAIICFDKKVRIHHSVIFDSWIICRTNEDSNIFLTDYKYLKNAINYVENMED